MRGKKLVSLKRGPSGFMGMRGKKSSRDPLVDLLMQRYQDEFYDEDFENVLEKRAPNGFMGMRGKKWLDTDMDTAIDYEKRSPALGFHGMRGKKENAFYDSSRYTELGGAKRSPKMGFHGMRGKRSAGAGRSFSVVKKVPYELRGRFVGVRGKKSEHGDLTFDES